MAKYIKLFETHQQYEAYTADTENFILPNVSVCEDAPTEVFYHPLIVCEETTVYEILGTPSYPSEIDGSDASFDISVNYRRTDIDSSCTETITEGTDTITVECGTNPSTSSTRTVTSSVTWNDIEIGYSLIQKYFDPYNGHDYVDLGLPSGTKWAKMNVGANSETDYGNYYQYGKGAAQYAATSGDSTYSGTENPLATSADTASQVWGGNWHMPTSAQCQELIDSTTHVWTTISGVKGVKFSANDGSGKYIFIPAAGKYFDGNKYETSEWANLWSSTYMRGTQSFAFECGIYQKTYYASVQVTNISYGFSVRGVVG